MRRRRIVAVADVAMMVFMVVVLAMGMRVRHAGLLYYNITQVYLTPFLGLADRHRQRRRQQREGQRYRSPEPASGSSGWLSRNGPRRHPAGRRG